MSSWRRSLLGFERGRWWRRGRGVTADESVEDAMSVERKWWFCLRHMAVEPAAGCANKHRMGPYETRAEAADAIAQAAERNKEWGRGETAKDGGGADE